jgi:WD40 repeat protein
LDNKRVVTFFHVPTWKEEKTGPADEGRLDAISSGRLALIIQNLGAHMCSLTHQFVVCTGAETGALSKDGKLAATIFYDAADWQNLSSRGPQSHALRGHTSRINDVTFDPGSTHILTASADKTVRIWPLERPKLAALASWDDIVSYFRNSTKACLTREQRVELLNEDPETAQVNANRCQKRVGP